MIGVRSIPIRSHRGAPGAVGVRTWLTYLASIVAGFLLPALLWAGLVIAQLGAPTASSEWTRGLYERKDARAAATGPDRLILVAGSNGVFNFDSERIEAATGRPVVNLATHAGLGLEYLLDRTERRLEPGDLVLLPLEYALYDETGRPSEVLLDHVFANDPPYLGSLPWPDRLRWVYGASPRRLLEGLLSRAGRPTWAPQRYDLADVNIRGDQEGTRAEEAGPVERGHLAASEPTRVLTAGLSPASTSWATLDDFLTRAEERGARVVATWPAALRFDAYEGPAADAAITEIRAFWTSRGIPVIGDPDDFWYEWEDMFDTSYHLHDAARDVNTERLLMAAEECACLGGHALGAGPRVER